MCEYTHLHASTDYGMWCMLNAAILERDMRQWTCLPSGTCLWFNGHVTAGALGAYAEYSAVMQKTYKNT